MKKRMSLSNLSGFTDLCKSELYTVGAKGTTCKGTVQKNDKKSSRIPAPTVTVTIYYKVDPISDGAQYGYRCVPVNSVEFE